MCRFPDILSCSVAPWLFSISNFLSLLLQMMSQFVHKIYRSCTIILWFSLVVFLNKGNLSMFCLQLRPTLTAYCFILVFLGDHSSFLPVCLTFWAESLLNISFDFCFFRLRQWLPLVPYFLIRWLVWPLSHHKFPWVSPKIIFLLLLCFQLILLSVKLARAMHL